MPRFTWFPRALILPHATPIATQAATAWFSRITNHSMEIPTPIHQITSSNAKKTNNKTPEEVKRH